jgi:hypothetical protein
MLSFSQRKGLTPVRTNIQRESADMALRNELWNALYSHYLIHFPSYLPNDQSLFKDLSYSYWTELLEKCIDQIPYSGSEIVITIKVQFLSTTWFTMFDILEFTPNNFDKKNFVKNKYNDEFVRNINTILEKHLSAYRFVDYKIVEITSDAEIAAIETAIESPETNELVKIHLGRALTLLSDRKNPDYRNSIKESISAIEAYAQIITNNPKATLGQALNILEKNHDLHEALKKSFSNLYGYTSDASGIRHALLDVPSLKQEDALFMLVTCSAFINYLKAKTSNQSTQ